MAKPLLHRVTELVFVAAVIVLGAVFCVPLALCTRLRQWLFVRLLGVASWLWPDDFEETRRATMAALDEVESHDPELRADGAVRLLEVGAGFGANFGFMRRKVKYWNVDPNTEFESAFLETLKNYPKGGRLIFMEHVAQPPGTLGLLLQNVFTPVWRLVFCGCCLNRESGELIKRAGFSEVHLRESRINVPILVSRHVYGYAVA